MNRRCTVAALAVALLVTGLVSFLPAIAADSAVDRLVARFDELTLTGLDGWRVSPDLKTSPIAGDAPAQPAFDDSAWAHAEDRRAALRRLGLAAAARRDPADGRRDGGRRAADAEADGQRLRLPLGQREGAGPLRLERLVRADGRRPPGRGLRHRDQGGQHGRRAAAAPRRPAARGGRAPAGRRSTTSRSACGSGRNCWASTPTRPTRARRSTRGSIARPPIGRKSSG